MQIVILADTHGYLDPRIAEAVRGADLLVHAGDVGAGIAEQIAGLADESVIVAGNNDPADSPWPAERVLDLPGGQLAVMHGHQWPARSRHRRLAARFESATAVVLGHSHRRVLETASTPWLINPGAAGKTRAYGGPSWVSLTATRQHWRVAEHVYTPLSRRGRR